MSTRTLPPPDWSSQLPDFEDFQKQVRLQARANIRAREEERRRNAPVAVYFRELKAIVEEEERKAPCRSVDALLCHPLAAVATDLAPSRKQPLLARLSLGPRTVIDRYRFANFTKAQPLFRCLARLGRGKVISVSVLSRCPSPCRPGTGEPRPRTFGASAPPGVGAGRARTTGRGGERQGRE